MSCPETAYPAARQTLEVQAKDPRELLAQGAGILAAAGISSPALDAALLLAEVLGVSREKLYTSLQPPDKAQRARFFSLIERRRGGEPAAYILGRKEFWGLSFALTPKALIPRPDTETLVEAALGFIKSQKSLAAPAEPPLRLLDLCAGSGAVAIALKHECPALEVWAADISAEVLELARKNALRLLGEGAAGITFLKGDLFDARETAPGEGGPGERREIPRTFSLITANPPYVPSGMIAALEREVRREPVLALDGGEDGLDLIRRIVAEAPAYLESRGGLFLEADPSQMEVIAALMETRGFQAVAVRRDLAGKGRVISGTLA
ncbi:MAG: peptide chain release factor N(5)-glutamine methyltransferase [Treponema sp.]|nr:peptide chain release factor N(5)-glutamine methyltransferase [Treponema sp.]